MNRKHLLAALRAKGYKGKVDLAEIKAFLLDEGGDAETIKLNGTEVKVAEIFAKAATFEADVETAEIETSEDSNESEDAEADAVVTKRAEPQGKRGDGWRASGLNSQFAISTGRQSMDTKRYETRIAIKASNPYDRRAAIFDDAESAQAFGSWARVTLARSKNEEHKRFGEDMDTLKRWGQKTGVTYSNTAGGATVPQEFMASLIWRTEQYGAARKVANVVRMSRDNMIVPRKTGIISMSFTQEASAPTAQDNSYDSVELTARKAMALVQVSNEWLEDSAINVADDYANSFAEAQAITEDQCLFLGDGSATYGGFRGLNVALPGGSTATSAASGAYLTAAAWSAYTLGTFNVGMGSVQNVKNSRCVFVGSRQFYHQVCVRLDKQATQFKDAGASAVAGFNGADASFLGFPYIFSQVMPTASSSNARSCYFGDISSIAMLGDRRDLRVEVSMDRYFDSDSTGIRATARIAVNVHGDGRDSTVGPVACFLGS